MRLKLLDNNHTELMVSRKQYPLFKRRIDSYIARHGGELTRETSRYMFFKVKADLLNRG